MDWLDATIHWVSTNYVLLLVVSLTLYLNYVNATLGERIDSLQYEVDSLRRQLNGDHRDYL